VFDSIADDVNAAPSIEQAACSTSHAVFRNDTKNKKLRIERKTLKDFFGVRIIKNIQRLLFDENLLVVQQIVGQLDFRTIRESANLLGKALRDNLSTTRAANTMGRKNLKFRVVWWVLVAARNEERAIPAGNIDQPLNVGNELFCPGDVKLAVREQKVHLHIHFPKNKVGIWPHDAIPRYARKERWMKIPHFIVGYNPLARSDPS